MQPAPDCGTQPGWRGWTAQGCDGCGTPACGWECAFVCAVMCRHYLARCTHLLTSSSVRLHPHTNTALMLPYYCSPLSGCHITAHPFQVAEHTLLHQMHPPPPPHTHTHHHQQQTHPHVQPVAQCALTSLSVPSTSSSVSRLECWRSNTAWAHERRIITAARRLSRSP